MVGERPDKEPEQDSQWERSRASSWSVMCAVAQGRCFCRSHYPALVGVAWETVGPCLGQQRAPSAQPPRRRPRWRQQATTLTIDCRSVARRLVFASQRFGDEQRYCSSFTNTEQISCSKTDTGKLRLKQPELQAHGCNEIPDGVSSRDPVA